MIRDAFIERLEWTIYDIASSPRVESFIIGYTSTPIEQRFISYRKMDYESIVALATNLTMADALNLEQTLFERIKDDRRFASFKKYHRMKREKRYFKSAGPGSSSPLALIHSVYMAWWPVA
jgi:hypothetical protein